MKSSVVPFRNAIEDIAMPEVLDSLAVAQLLRVHLTTVQDLARRGQLPGRKVGKDYRFLREAVVAWLGQTMAHDPQPRRSRQ